MLSHCPTVAHRIIPALALALTLAACGAPAAGPAPTAAPAATSAPAPTAAPAANATVDLEGIKTYLTGKTGELKAATAELKAISDRYYDLAKSANFDYAALAKQQPAELAKLIGDARAAWKKASPLYEQMEGIVAGTPSLAQYDVDMDAGASGAEDPENAVSFDLTLPDGKTLPKPGNLFGVTESTLWGTFADFRAKDVSLDVDGDGAIGFGDGLPDANVLKAGVDELAAQAAKLDTSAAAWQPSETDAFTALVVMVPTMSEYFDSWKNSRFIAGDASEQRDFVAISRLADIQNILGSLQVVHQNLSPLIQTASASDDAQIGKGLNDLKAFVADVYQKEQSGQRFSAEDADLLGKEAQDRATAITGQVSQVAAKLNIKIAE
ncbi:MAG TPA: imelysin family protein [Roseiflexaceae bacterium]|nr:imelysin family protein [Roseiflexaceae bacterium]